jgi:integrase/recombinase XerD
MKAKTAIFIDSYHPKSDGKCSISIRITHNRIRRYYQTPISLSPEDFEKVLGGKPREPFKTIRIRLGEFESQAADVIDTLQVFTFSQFEALYLTNTEAADSIKVGFERHIQELKSQKRIGTAVSYETAQKSIETFKPGLKYADITVTFLNRYEASMLEAGKSKATIGIYLRSLRTIMNRADIDRKLYPFGTGKNKYSIPSGRNFKKALSLAEISLIYNYSPEAGTVKAMAKDYWVFIYLCNGLNVKDLCLLKWKNIEGDILRYERAKTSRSKKDTELITVSLKPEAKAILSRWGQPAINPEAFTFPHLNKGMSAEREREIYQQLTKTINKYMKIIAEDLKIFKPVTTYYARHSFATVLKNSGASMEFISEALGHSDMKTTKNYLAGFEQETIHKTTDALTAFNK